ncbi:hypothetical protein [Tenacibaculum ovolyticum]|uniref:hypothetical protein n=1 Tax=Tenacibaculum ovolyticum TaxID=104270 RepID=UPI003BA9F2EE
MAGNFDENEKRIREKILSDSIRFEKLASACLAMFLGIDLKTSKTIGNSSQALSFNDKMNIFLDMKSINKEERNALQNFMSIRNQFMHNFDSDSFINCLANLNGVGKNLIKNFPIKEVGVSEEEKYEKCYDELQKKIQNLFNRLVRGGLTQIQNRNK